MADESLKEFVVRVLYESDADSAKRLDAAMEKLDKRFAGIIAGQEKAQKESTERLKTVTREAVLQARLIGDAIEAVASRVVTATMNITDNFSRLYFISKNTNTSIAGIKAFGFAVGQMGGDAKQAQGELDALGNKIRASAGGYLQIFANQGVNLKDAKGQIRDINLLVGDLVRKLNKDQSKNGQAIETSVLDSLGFSPATQQALRAGIEENEKLITDMATSMGVDMDKLGASSVKFQNSLTTAGEAVNLIWAKAIQNLMTPDKGGKTALDRLVDTLVKNGPELSKTAGDIATGISNIATALGDLFSKPVVADQINKTLADIREVIVEINTLIDRITDLNNNHIFRFFFRGGSGTMPQETVDKTIKDQNAPGADHRSNIQKWFGNLFDMGAHADELPADASQNPLAKNAAQSDQMVAILQRIADQTQRVGDLLFVFFNSKAGGAAGGPFDAANAAAAGGGWGQGGVVTGSGAAGASAAPAEPQSAGQAAWGMVKRFAGNTLRAVGVKTDLGQDAGGSGVNAGDPRPGNPADAVAFLMAHGMTELGAAGLVGSGMTESGLQTNPRGSNDGGQAHGVFQWHDRFGPAAEWARSQGLDPSDYKTQLLMALHEGQEGKEKSSFAEMNSATTPEGAALGGRHFERPSAQDQAVREANTRKALAAYRAALAGGTTLGGNPGGKGALAFGDSLGEGLKMLGLKGDAVQGRSPEAVLKAIQATDDRGRPMAGQDVYLSSGMSNAPTHDPAIVSQMITALQARGAKVHVLGVGDRADFVANHINEKLQALSEKQGAIFEPLSLAPGDMQPGGVHPTASGYKKILARLKDIPTAPPASGGVIDTIKGWADFGRAAIAAQGAAHENLGILPGGAHEMEPPHSRFQPWMKHPSVAAGSPFGTLGGVHHSANAWSSLQGSSRALNVTATRPYSKDRAHAWSQLQGTATDEDPRDALMRTEAIKARNYDILHRPRPLVHPGATSSRGGGGDKHVNMGGNTNHFTITGVDNGEHAAQMVASRIRYENNRMLAQFNQAVA